MTSCRGQLPKADVLIVGLSARSASGLTALQVTMSARAQIFEPRESHMIDQRGQPIVTSRLPSIGDHIFGLDRFLALGAPTLRQATYPWLSAPVNRGGPQPIPIFVALPNAQRPGFDPRLRTHLLRALEIRSGVPIDESRSVLVYGCRGGGVAAIERAIAELAKGAAPVVAVGGIDSYFDPDVLESLDAERRLHGPDTENGFIPGEGCGFLLLTTRRHTVQLSRYAQIISTSIAEEPRPWGSAEPSLGLGITLALKRATSPLGAEARRIPWVLTDVANERHRVDEWMYGFARTFSAFTPDVVHDQPLLKTGDLGAASASVLLAVAATAWQTGCAPGDAVIIATHSDGPERGALLASTEP